MTSASARTKRALGVAIAASGVAVACAVVVLYHLFWVLSYLFDVKEHARNAADHRVDAEELASQVPWLFDHVRAALTAGMWALPACVVVMVACAVALWSLRAVKPVSTASA